MSDRHGSEARPAPPALDRARASLEGLSVGDAFGEQFFRPPDAVAALLASRTPPPAPWPFTDDTMMAIGLVQVLAKHGRIDRDELAATFAANYRAQPHRGYGGMAHTILAQIGAGVPWRVAAGRVFGGSGSMGNGAAMRVAPVGAFFADDLERAAIEAGLSAQVTHAHSEGQAGAIAVAVAAAFAAKLRAGPRPSHPDHELLERAIEFTPPSETRSGLSEALALSSGCSVGEAVAVLGSGRLVTAPNTVPFALWCAARHLDSYEEALWTTVSGLGDRDTTCAIVGGIVVLATGVESIPGAWRRAREPLPRSI